MRVLAIRQVSRVRPRLSRANWQTALTDDLPYGKSVRMKLAAYLTQQNLKPAQFAERIGVPASTITRILSGAREPRLKTVVKIETGTDGAVRIADFVEASEAECPAPPSP